MKVKIYERANPTHVATEYDRVTNVHICVVETDEYGRVLCYVLELPGWRKTATFPVIIWMITIDE